MNCPLEESLDIVTALLIEGSCLCFQVPSLNPYIVRAPLHPENVYYKVLMIILFTAVADSKDHVPIIGVDAQSFIQSMLQSYREIVSGLFGSPHNLSFNLCLIGLHFGRSLG